MEGWISLHRKFLEWQWFDDKNMVVLFIYILLKANHSPNKWQGFDIGRGEMVTSINKLSQALNISEQTVRTCLKKLEKTGEINKQSNTKLTKLIICKYDSYQDSQQTNNKPLTNEQQATNKQLTTNNNDNKENNENNDYKKTLLSDLKQSDFEDPTYFEIAISFYELFKKNLTDAGASTSTLEKATGKWIDQIRLLIETDKQELENIRKVFLFLQTNEFWKKNILSAAKLREKFNTLLLNSKENGTNKGNNSKSQGCTTDELKNILSKHFD